MNRIRRVYFVAVLIIVGILGFAVGFFPQSLSPDHRVPRYQVSPHIFINEYGTDRTRYIFWEPISRASSYVLIMDGMDKWEHIEREFDASEICQFQNGQLCGVPVDENGYTVYVEVIGWIGDSQPLVIDK